MIALSGRISTVIELGGRLETIIELSGRVGTFVVVEPSVSGSPIGFTLMFLYA